MINSTCANAKPLWLGDMKSVTWPSQAQLEKLRVASMLCQEDVPVVMGNDGVTIEVTLQAYAAAELVISVV